MKFWFLTELLIFSAFSFYCGGDQIIICECNELVGGNTFKDYIKTTVNPSTRTIGHKKRCLTFNFIDEKSQKKYSSRKELKILAGKFVENNLPPECTAKFLLEVHRLKSRGRLQDSEIMVRAYRKILELYPENLLWKKT